MKAVMYGGGNIGRGFIGALLSQSGYRVTFIDVAPPVVEHLQKNECYPIRYVFSGGHEDVLVENVTAVNGNDMEAASDAIATCDIMATAVGARILKFIIPNIVAGLRKRWAANGGPLNIIICENLMDANKVLEELLKKELTPEEQERFDRTVGLVEASIGRMVPVQTEEMKDGDPLRVCVERYGFLPVDKDAAIASGIVKESDKDLMVDTVYIELKKSSLSRSELMLLDMLPHSTGSDLSTSLRHICSTPSDLWTTCSLTATHSALYQSSPHLRIVGRLVA